MTTSSKIILGIVGAAAAGVAIGMLIAPEKTKELCEKLKCGVSDWTNDLKKSITKTVSGLQDDIEQATT